MLVVVAALKVCMHTTSLVRAYTLVMSLVPGVCYVLSRMSCNVGARVRRNTKVYTYIIRTCMHVLASTVLATTRSSSTIS